MDLRIGFLGSVVLVVVIILGGSIIRFVRLACLPKKPASNWPGVEGFVYICRVDTRHDDHGNELAEPGIRCIYQVNQITYILSLERVEFLRCTQHEWENVGQYWPNHFAVRVHYDPKNPQRAVVSSVRNS
jgi:hypothetical protein